MTKKERVLLQKAYNYLRTDGDYTGKFDCYGHETVHTTWEDGMKLLQKILFRKEKILK